jgi:hypothetical protein
MTGGHMKNIRTISTLLMAQLVLLQSFGAQADVQNFYRVKNTGRKATKVISYSKIPKNQPIPRLDLGEEITLEAEPAIPLFSEDSRSLKKVKVPEVKKISLTDKESVNYNLLKTVVPALNKSQQVLNGSKIKTVSEKDFLSYEPPSKVLENNYKTVVSIKASEYKMLEGLLLLHREQKYPLALGVFAELLNDPEYNEDSKYYLALAAYKLNLYKTYQNHMLKLLDSPQEKWKTKALSHFAENIKTDDGLAALKIQKTSEDLNIDLQSQINYQIALIEALNEKGEFKEALSVSEEFLKNVDLSLIKKNPAIAQVPIIRGLIFYKLAEIDEAEKVLKSILSEIDKNDELANPRSVASMTLARIYFQRGKYKEAYATYLGVDKNNPLWLQSLLEQGWSQVLMNDFEGSAGNMFSLHTDFFKYAFIPESYIIRSISYLNLCQYGDGLQILKDMNKKYRPIKSQLEAFEKLELGAEKYYDTVKRFLKFPQLNEVNGLPKAFILEMAHHPSFVTSQDHINQNEDEIIKWNEMSSILIAEENEVLKKQIELQTQLQKVKMQLAQEKSLDKFNENRVKLNENNTDLENWIYLKQQKITLFKNAQIALKPLKENSIAVINKDKETLKLAADNSLKKQFKSLTQNFNTLLDQTDVLTYEIFSGAGEHIRFQAAVSGSDIKPKEVNTDKSSTEKEESQLKPTHNLSWNFKGEIWEDEIGHYRSSLKNICPQEEAKDHEEEPKIHPQTSNF